MHGDQILKVAQKLSVKPQKLTDFSASLNPYGPPSGLYTVLKANLKQLPYYPADHQDLISLLSKANQVEADQIILGNGSAELIYFLAFFLKPNTALLIEPTFTEYRLALKAVNCQITTVLTEARNNFCPDIKQVRQVLPKVEVVFLSNPNNPTGYLWGRELIQLVENFPQVMFIIDEAFIDFTEANSLAAQTLNFSNLIILRSLTKIYSLPGLRLGYLVANQFLSLKMRRCRQPWAVNSLAVKAGCFLLQQADFVSSTRSKLKKADNLFRKELSEVKCLKIYPSAANFFLVEIKSSFTADYLAARLLSNNLILIRPAANFFGLNQKFFRLTVLKARQNKKVVEAIKEVITCQNF